MAECSLASTGLVEALHRFPFHMGVVGDHHLGYSFAGIDGKGCVAEVDHNHAYLAPVVGIDGAGSVDKRYAAAQGEAAARAYLALMPLRELDAQSGGHESPLERLEHYWLLYGGVDVHSGGRGGFVGRELISGAVDYLYFDAFHRWEVERIRR